MTNSKRNPPLKKSVFFSSHDWTLSMVRVVNGSLLFGSEIGFVCSLALILRSYGIVSLQGVSYFSDWSNTQKVSVLCFFLFCRGVFGWADCIFARWGNENFRSRVREGLVQWVLSQRSIDQSAFFGRFFPEADASAQAITDIQIFSRTVIKLCLLLVVQLYIAPELSVLILLGILLMGYPVHLVARASSKQARKQLASTKALNMVVIRNVKNLLLLRVHGVVSLEFDKVRSLLGQVSKGGVFMAVMEGAVSSYCHMLTALLVLGVTWMGRAHLIFNPTLSLIYFYAQYQFLMGLLNLYRALPAFRVRRETLMKLKSWWEEQDFSALSASSKGKTSRLQSPFLSSAPLGWKWTSVDFGYGPNKPLFQNVSLEIRPGESIALCGPSGVGKTSFIHLLLGDVAPEKGEISVSSSEGDFPVLQCRDELLLRISYVGATSFLIPGTLNENLVYGLNRSVDAEEISEALATAACDFISTLPGGLQYVLDDHCEGLSSGQKQRLCIARALLRKPKALLLDEVTAHLDEETEMKLVKGIRSLNGKVTVVCATHRSALVPAMDRKISLPLVRPAARPVASEKSLPSLSL